MDADDTDFLSQEVELRGFLDRCAVKMPGEISNVRMAALAKRRGNFKRKYFELKGETLFYRKHQTVPQGFTYNITFKVDLASVYSGVLARDHRELLLNVQEEGAYLSEGQEAQYKKKVVFFGVL